MHQQQSGCRWGLPAETGIPGSPHKAVSGMSALGTLVPGRRAACLLYVVIRGSLLAVPVPALELAAMYHIMMLLAESKLVSQDCMRAGAVVDSS